MDTQLADHGYSYQKLQALKALLGLNFRSLHLRAAHIEAKEISSFADFAVELESDTEIALLHLANGWFTPPGLPGIGHLNLTLRTYHTAEVMLQDAPSDARAEYESVTKPLGVRYSALDIHGPLEEVQVNEGHEDRPLLNIDPDAEPAAGDPQAFDIRSVESIVLYFAEGAALLLVSDEDRVAVRLTSRKELEAGKQTLYTNINGYSRKIESIRVSAIAS
ncbi:hypothetical protein [Neolewinella litorea]|uniref:Uncharacterized protein n=1 Tax=Neolewinella litorea TaxID=2562452 RepID=A0A4S4NI68_9BACT|nr:hypothetical protein [Neolewinella litorea]THH37901.1 hypothetical protein E4021_12750 [Neolewinella litorea]